MNHHAPTRSRVPGDLPIRLAGTGDRWRVTRGRPAYRGDLVRWYAAPVEIRGQAFYDRKHAIFATQPEALEYAIARHRGTSHENILVRELGPIIRMLRTQRGAHRVGGDR